MNMEDFESQNAPSRRMTKTGHIATYIEMWFLSFLFISVVATLLRVQHVQVQSQSQARQERDAQEMEHSSRISRNNTPALGY